MPIAANMHCVMPGGLSPQQPAGGMAKRGLMREDFEPSPRDRGAVTAWKGERFELLDTAGEWTEVAFAPERVGFVPTSFVLLEEVSMPLTPPPSPSHE